MGFPRLEIVVGGKWLFLLLVVAGFLSLSLHESVTRKCQLVEFFLFRVLGFGNHD